MTLAFPHLWIPARNILSPAADWLAATSSALRTRPASSAQRNRCGDAAMEMQDPSCCGGCNCSNTQYTVTFSGVSLASNQNCNTCGGASATFDYTGVSLGTYCLNTYAQAGNICRWSKIITSPAFGTVQTGLFPTNMSLQVALQRDVSSGTPVWTLTADSGIGTSFTTGKLFLQTVTGSVGDCASAPAFNANNYTAFCNGDCNTGWSGSATTSSGC